MGNLKLWAMFVVTLLWESPVALRIVTGIVAFVVLVLAITLVLTFPAFFTAIFMLGVLVLVLYTLGNIIWGIIGS